jgi:hypothetical protein
MSDSVEVEERSSSVVKERLLTSDFRLFEVSRLMIVSYSISPLEEKALILKMASFCLSVIFVREKSVDVQGDVTSVSTHPREKFNRESVQSPKTGF